MTIIDHCSRHWTALAPDARRALLTEIMNASPWSYIAGRTAEQMSFAREFDDLPADIQSCLIWSLTEAGFSVDELVRCQLVVGQHVLVSN